MAQRGCVQPREGVYIYMYIYFFKCSYSLGPHRQPVLVCGSNYELCVCKQGAAARTSPAAVCPWAPGSFPAKQLLSCRTQNSENRPRGKPLSLLYFQFFSALSRDLQDKSVCFASCVLFCVSRLHGNTPAILLLPAADANRASSQENVTSLKINSAARWRVLSLVSCWNVSAKTESRRIKIQLPTSNKEGFL